MYTIKEFIIKLDHATKKIKDDAEILKKNEQLEWERARWISANFMNSMGAKLTSVYSLTVFPWETPPPKPTEDILSKFPKTLT